MEYVNTKVAVCVCTCRRPQMLSHCLDSLNDQVLPPWIIPTIIIIDNDPVGSAKPVIETFKTKTSIQIINSHEPRRGIAVARNAALDLAMKMDADWIAFIDDDELASPDWLASLMSSRYWKIPVLAGSRVEIAPNPTPFWYVPRKRKYLEGRKQTTASTANVRFSRALTDAGLRFDESLGLAGGEDTLFFARASLLGFEIRRTDLAITLEESHPERLTYMAQMYREYWSGQVSVKKNVLMNGKLRGTFLNNIPAAFSIIPGVAEVLVSPIFYLFSLDSFKDRALSGGRKIAKGAGRVAGMLGLISKPYRKIVGR